MNKEEQRIQESAKQALDSSLASININTQARLQESRKRALENAATPTVWQSIFKPLPIASALAFSFALFISLPQWQSNTDTKQTDILADQQDFDDFLLLSDIDDDTLELIEDLEFALWLTEEMNTPNEGLEFEKQAANKPPAIPSDKNVLSSSLPASIRYHHA